MLVQEERQRGAGPPGWAQAHTLALLHFSFFLFCAILFFFFFKPITLETSMKIPHIPTANKMISLIQITEV